MMRFLRQHILYRLSVTFYGRISAKRKKIGQGVDKDLYFYIMDLPLKNNIPQLTAFLFSVAGFCADKGYIGMTIQDITVGPLRSRT